MPIIPFGQKEILPLKSAEKAVMADNSLEADAFEKRQTGRAKEEKQAMLKDARTTAAGWSIVFPYLSTLYYGLRPDGIIIDKYGLNGEDDKNLVSEIKKQQVIQTLPSVLLPVMGGIAAWSYNSVKDPNAVSV